MPYLSIFGLELKKTIVIFDIGNLKFVKNESLTHIVNFSIGSTCSKCPGSTFSEGLGPGSGLLYKDVLITISKSKYRIELHFLRESASDFKKVMRHQSKILDKTPSPQ